VDNSIDGSAIWATLDPNLACHLSYLHVSTPGLTNARNAALAFARARNASIAFIDDDEIPGKNWLKSANHAAQYARKEIVAGPVIPLFEIHSVPNPLPKSFWERPSREDGSIVKGFVGDGNIVYPADLLATGLNYSHEFNLSGGQDTDYLFRAKKLGFLIRNRNDLLVTELVPLKRQGLDYLLDRAFHSSSAWVAVCRANHKFVGGLYLSILKRIVLSLTFSFLGLATLSEIKKAKSQIYAASVRGSVFGLRGKTVNRYSKYQTEED
jgi:succinoglycan biosynthesis protein ExoM